MHKNKLISFDLIRKPHTTRSKCVEKTVGTIAGKRYDGLNTSIKITDISIIQNLELLLARFKCNEGMAVQGEAGQAAFSRFYVRKNWINKLKNY
jgi:hypothetical protein